MAKVQQTLPENTRVATKDDFFVETGDNTFLKTDVVFFQKTPAGYVEKISNHDMSGPNLFRNIHNEIIFVYK